MNIGAIRARMRTREVSERKQVGDAESLLNAKKWNETMANIIAKNWDRAQICRAHTFICSLQIALEDPESSTKIQDTEIARMAGDARPLVETMAHRLPSWSILG